MTDKNLLPGLSEGESDKLRNQLKIEAYNVYGYKCEVVIMEDTAVAIDIDGKRYYRGTQLSFCERNDDKESNYKEYGRGFLVDINVEKLKRGDSLALSVIDQQGQRHLLKLRELTGNHQDLGPKQRPPLTDDTHGRLVDAADLDVER